MLDPISVDTVVIPIKITRLNKKEVCLLRS